MIHPRTSIVILTRNELAYTKQCVESIQRCTPEPYELVFVDNGSDDGTVEWLQNVPGATVITNERNAGFGGGCNQGMAASSGDRILLLNNDVVVTPGWLAALHRELDVAGDVGMSGPRSNFVAGEQVVQPVDYDEMSLDGLDRHAAAWSSGHADQGHDAQRLIGLCMLIRREVIEQVGGFDLRYGIGNFEDDDICLRVVIAGWRLRIADDSFIHHYGNRTFIGQKVDYSATMQENFRRFGERWRIRAEEIGSNGSYDSRAIARRTTFDAHDHYAPLVMTPAVGTKVDFEGRATSLLVCCDRADAQSTREQLDAVFAAVSNADDVTIVVRIDARDELSHDVLEDAADRAAAALPDIVLIEASDDNDMAAITACDLVLVHGPASWSRAANARWAGRTPITVDDLAGGGVDIGSSSGVASA